MNLFAPPTEHVDAVKAWLASTGIAGGHAVSLSSNRQWLQFDTPVSALENLLQTQYHEYEHSSGSSIAVGCDE